MASKAAPEGLRREWMGKLLWPVVALALLGLFNLLFTDGFFHTYSASFFGQITCA